MNRRDLLRLAATVPLMLGSAPRRALSTEDTRKPGSPLRLGVVSYSLRELSLDEMLRELRQLEVESVSLYWRHAPIEKGAPDDCLRIAEIVRAAGVQIAGTGVVEVRNDESTMRRAFDNARAAGIRTLTVKPEPDCLPLLERFADTYDIRIAIHNHGPEDANFPSPEESLRAALTRGPRIGVCIDAGHAARAGADPVAMIRKCRNRLYDFHLKDSIAPVGAMKDSPVAIGRGRLDIKGILLELMEAGYAGQVGIEYDCQNVNLASGLAESLGFVRGLLARDCEIIGVPC